MRLPDISLKSLKRLLKIPSKLRLIQNWKVMKRNTAKKSTIAKNSEKVGKKTKAMRKMEKMRKTVFGQKLLRKQNTNCWIHQKGIVTRITTQKKTPMIKVKIALKLSMVKRGLSCSVRSKW
jgi:hypothetical protein